MLCTITGVFNDKVLSEYSSSTLGRIIYCEATIDCCGDRKIPFAYRFAADSARLFNRY